MGGGTNDAFQFFQKTVYAGTIEWQSYFTGVNATVENEHDI